MEITKFVVAFLAIIRPLLAIHCDKELNYHETYAYGFDIICEGLTAINDVLLKNISVSNEIVLTINNSSLPITAEIFQNVKNIRYLIISNSTISFRPNEAPLKNLKKLEHISVENTIFSEPDETIFLNVTSVKELSLRNNNLSALKPEVMKYLRNLEVLRLSSNRFNKLSSIPLCQLRRLRHFFADRNEIDLFGKEFVCNQTFSQTSLIEIDLSFNRISELGSFASVHKLRRLNLEHNLIIKIEENSIKMLSKLEQFNLRNNRVKSIDTKAFSHLVNLKSIDLFNNSLKSVNLEGLLNLESVNLSGNALTLDSLTNIKELPKLKSLDLSGNEITGIVQGFFENLTSLQFLSLSNNKVLLTDKTFSNLVNLKNLAVRNNKIEMIPPQIFKNLSELEVLDLSQNSIESTLMDQEIFSDLENLQVLNLSFNLFEHLNYDKLQPLHNLQVLDIAGNKLQNFQFDLISSLPSLAVINIKSNLISCDILSNIIAFLNSKHISFNVNEELHYDKKNIAGIYCKETLAKLSKTGGSGISVAQILFILLIVLFSIVIASAVTYRFIVYSRRRNYVMDEIELFEE